MAEIHLATANRLFKQTEPALFAGEEADAFFGHHTIGCIAGCEDEHPRPVEFVDDRMYLAVAATFRKLDRLQFGPPFPPLAQLWAFTWLLSKAYRDLSILSYAQM